LQTANYIEDNSSSVKGGGEKNVMIIFVILLIIFSVFLVDAGIVKQSVSKVTHVFRLRQISKDVTPLEKIVHDVTISNKIIEIAKNISNLSKTVKENTPPILKDITSTATNSIDTAALLEMSMKRQLSNIYQYILHNIILRNINKDLKKKIILFMHICFTKEIVPLFFTEIREPSIQFANIILWCIQNKVFETFTWLDTISKKYVKKVKDFTEMKMLTHISTETHLANIGGSFTRKISNIRSKKNIKHRKKNAKITMRNTMMYKMMTPK
jgi:hypothetical protein